MAPLLEILTLYTIKMLQKKQYTTPTTRFATFIRFFDFHKIQTLKFLKRKKSIKPYRKLFYKNPNINISTSFGVDHMGVVKDFLYNKKPYQVFLLMQTVYGTFLNIPGVENLLPGNKIFDLTKNIIFKKICY